MFDSDGTVDTDTAIAAYGISKSYRLGEYLSLASTMANTLRRRLGTPRPDPFQALSDVSFEIRRGECFGIVGGNGSGKSTLLQLISGITVPTHGELRVRGKVLPFLQVGAGFHPELTGRENIVLYGTVMGIPRETILASIDRVAAFAEIERHIDTPNKRYSDGMQARLSFAIAILFPAHIYLFDEVLAVVDDEFRARCLAEIDGLTRAGRTVIFVSHDLGQVREVCSRAMWLQNGAVQAVGSTDEVTQLYSRSQADGDDA
jgi:ABC-type polysaccharide/polyol phosphate transport system ATPase subunit